MAITYHNSASTPTTQNGSNSASPTVVTPPASMTSGDLVVVCSFNRLKNGTHAVSAAGGQSWTKLTTVTSASVFTTATWFWCIYDGTWDTSPSFSHGGTNNTCMMLVFRPTAGKSWDVDVAEAPALFAAPGSPYDITITQITAASASVAIASWASQDDNDYALQAGASWVQARSISNLAGQDSCVMMAYKLMPAGGATGSPVGRQVAVGGDAGCQNIASFKEVTAGVTLTVADAAHGLISDAPVLTQKHTLVSVDATHGQIADGTFALTQKHILAVNDTAHGLITDGDLILVQSSQLSVNDTAHELTSDSPILTQKHTLVVNDTAHSVTSDVPALVQKHTLVVSETAHSNSADSPVLTQKHVLVVSETLHANTVDASVLTQKHTLSVNDTVHGLISDNIDLVYSEGGALVVSDTLHGLISDSPVLSQKHTLVSIDAVHELISNVPILTQAHTLVVAETIHGHTVDGDLTLTQTSVLVPSETVHILTSGTPVLTQKHLLSVNNVVHEQTVDGDLVLVQSGVITLVVADTVHTLSSDVINLIVLITISRIITSCDAEQPQEIWTETGSSSRMIRISTNSNRGSNTGGNTWGNRNSTIIRRIRGDL